MTLMFDHFVIETQPWCFFMGDRYHSRIETEFWVLEHTCYKNYANKLSHDNHFANGPYHFASNKNYLTGVVDINGWQYLHVNEDNVYGQDNYHMHTNFLNKELYINDILKGK